MVKTHKVDLQPKPMVIKQRTAAFKKAREWKRRVREAIGFPNFGIEVWRPILEDFGKCEIHHTD